MADNLFIDELSANWEEEGLFARDVNGQLIRAEKAVREDYEQLITLTIDGEEVTVPKAVPTKDAQGNIIFLDGTGRTKPRRTTIHDAALVLAQKLNPHNPRVGLSIPTLCHAEHLTPVGVCRVCSVEVSRLEKDRKDPSKTREVTSDKLVPACVQPVENGMVVHTSASPNQPAAQRVRQQVKVLLELLAGDHLRPDNHGPSELSQLVARLTPELGIEPRRYSPAEPLAYPPDRSSSLIAVDHNACILCDRCVRACTDIKENFVIGRTGKGYSTRIGFDLNDPLGQSSCVACGECMLHCPTTALTFQQPAADQNPNDSAWYREELQLPGRYEVSSAEMDAHPLLRALPQRYRDWNRTSLVRRTVQAGDELCRLGDHGSTAFILISGRYGVWRTDPRIATQQKRAVGVWERVSHWFRQPPKIATELGPHDAEVTPAQLILGEMTCLNHQPRSATIQALTAGEFFEVRRNVLFALQKNPTSREILDATYREHALRNHLARVALFAGLSDKHREHCVQYLLKPGADGQPRVNLLRLQPGQTIFRQGELANDAQAAFYIIRIGHVKVSQSYAGQERVVNYLGPNKHFGELGLLAENQDFRDLIPPELTNRRTATCTALDDVELVVIKRDEFRKLVLHEQLKPLRDYIQQQAAGYVERQHANPGPPRPSSPLLEEFTAQGLYNAQKLLVLDLEACTRCDECVKACADTHGGVTRLVRDGLRFDKWLVASACRSCTDPYCLVGCPVDAIHREGGRLEIQIADNCIGCGQCAKNCPYGNINMHSTSGTQLIAGQLTSVSQSQATTCDLCHDLVGPEEEVSCVFACPHHAAFRMSGPELLQIVSRQA